MLGGGGDGGAGLGLDLSAVIQAAVVGLVLFSAAIIAVRRAASRYFVVDAAGFAASYDDHHHHHSPPASPAPPRGDQGPMAREQAAGGVPSPCAECGATANTKNCSGCKRVRYCSQSCQTKHWQSDHKFKCKQLKKMDPGDNGGKANSKKSSGFGCISLVPSHGKFNNVIFPYEEFLKLYDWKDLDFLPCGLVNCGNSCFANVVLQCLSCTRPLVAYLLGKDHSRECSRRHEDWCFLCELQCHIQRASESLHPFAPMNILSHLPNIGGNLGFGRQEDAHEFMRFAIDKMQSACLDEFGGEKAVDLSSQETTLIQHIFGGRLQSQVQCTACGMVSNRYDNMMDLTVEIQGDAGSLEECLDQFTAVEWLDGDNKYKCDGCNDYVKARKHLTVHQAPNILTITLKRFQSGRFGKLNKRVTFPTKLDLSPYMSTTDGSDLYDLYAVVVHLDMLNASFFGHYICYIKDCRGRWYRIDDCKVMIVDEEEVHAQGAYMLLYSRRTARPKPLISVKEPLKQQQCKSLSSEGQNHLIPEVVSLNCESVLKPSENSVLKPSENLREDSEHSNDNLHKTVTVDQESDLDLNMSIERVISTSNKNPHLPVSSVSHVLDQAARGPSTANKSPHLPVSSELHVLDQAARVPSSPLEDSSTVRSPHFDSYTSSSLYSSAEQHEEHASCTDSADYMEIDSEAPKVDPEANTEVERLNEQQLSVLSDSIGVISNEASAPTLENGMAGKPKPLFSVGFLDKPSRKFAFVDDGQIGDNRASFSQKLNGYSNGHLSRSEQGVLTIYNGDHSSSGNEQCNGDIFVKSNNDNHLLVNGDTKSSNASLHADKQFMPCVSYGPRPYIEPSGSNINQSNISNDKIKVQNSPVKECRGDMSFLTRGFLQRDKSVISNDDLPFSNGKPSSFFVNGNNKLANTPSRSSVWDEPIISLGCSTKHCNESAAMGNFTRHGQETSSDIFTEQTSIHAEVVPDEVRESWRSDCTTNGTVFLHTSSDVNGHLDENGQSYLGTRNTRCGEENNSDGTLYMNGSSYRRDDTTAMLVSEKGMGSENADHLKFIPSILENDGLRQRLTSNFPEQEWY